MLGPKSIASAQTVLSPEECLAKTRTLSNGTIEASLDVTSHCLIVGEVARGLLQRIPTWLRELFFPNGTEVIVASHDLGKISPCFQEMIHRALTIYKPNSLDALRFADPEKAYRKNDAFHATISQAALEGVGKYIPEIVGCHHGSSPRIVFGKNSEIYGGPLWQAQRELVISTLMNHFQVQWPEVRNELQALVLSGLTTVADWIGSGSAFENVTKDSESWSQNVTRALDSAGYLFPEVKKGLSFFDVFGFQEREIQTTFVQSVRDAGVFVLEAPMGSGKTEAALYAAYKILEAGKATGIYFALPTQLTSNKIHERMKAFLERIQTDGSAQKAQLIHSSAWLYEDQMEMGEDAQPGGSWFDARKRGLLAPFGVGTVDQALMAVMNVKHGFVRTFGLTGKVVILDEVHSYDSYTGSLLNQLVKSLRELHCTVIVLSATLTGERRQSLLGTSDSDAETSTAYPLITSWALGEDPQEWVVSGGTEGTVTLHQETSEDCALDEALIRAGTGQQVLWIENTVSEAQEKFKQLSARRTETMEVGLLHSRFLREDRDKIEKTWVDLFGKNAADKRALKGRILVGTQVLEQSLDIDVDFLITRLAPTDMLLQRIGRLWRHEETKRPDGSCREFWILSPTYSEMVAHPHETLGKSQFVYAPYVLCRSLEVWEKIHQIRLPLEIRNILESTYLEREEDGVLQRLKTDLEKEKEKLEGLALVGLSRLGSALPETTATRYADRENCDVLLLRSFRRKDQNLILELLNGESLILPRNLKKRDRREWRRLAVELFRNLVTVSEHQAPSAIRREELKGLEEYIYLGSDEENSLRVALVQLDGTLTGLNQADALPGWNLRYDDKLGYLTTKKVKSSFGDEGW